MSQINSAIKEFSNAVLMIVIYALVIGSILGSTVFAAITLVNITTLSATYGDAITALTAFFVVGGTIVGILFFWRYAKNLLSGSTGLGAITA